MIPPGPWMKILAIAPARNPMMMTHNQCSIPFLPAAPAARLKSAGFVAAFGLRVSAFGRNRAAATTTAPNPEILRPVNFDSPLR
jgi:hypothetical protein